MNVPTVIAVIGGVAFLIGIFGGSIKIKEIEIPSINTKIRIFSILMGTILIATAVLLTNPAILTPAPPETMSPGNAETFPPVSDTPTSIQPPLIITSQPRKLTFSDYGGLLFEDTFDNDTGAWALQKESKIQNGALALSPGEYTVPVVNAEYSNFIFEMGFQFISVHTPDYSGVSVYFRYKLCPGNCSTRVGLSTKGMVNAWNYSDTKPAPISPGAFASLFDYSKANKITVIVNGEDFHVFLNDVLVRTFSDPTYKSGSIALAAEGVLLSIDYVRFYALP